MKPLGRNTNSLIRTARAAGLREKTTRKKRLTDRARTFRKSGLDVQKNMRRPAAGAFFYLTSPFIGQCCRSLHMFVISNASWILARDRPRFTEWNISLENGKSVHKPPFRGQKREARLIFRVDRWKTPRLRTRPDYFQ